MAQLTQMDASGALVWALETFENPPAERAGGRGVQPPYGYTDPNADSHSKQPN